MRPLFLRLAGFTGLPLLSILTPFVLTPVMARIAGPQGWSSIGAAQAIGTFGAACILFGWNVLGPVRIAQAADSQERSRIYRESIRSRLLLCTIVVPVVTTLTWVLSEKHVALAASALACSVALSGLTPAWFIVGLGQPKLLAQYDALPRVAAVVIAAVLLAVTREIILYPLLLVIASVASLVAFSKREIDPPDGTTIGWSRIRASLREQSHACGINVTGTAYTALPVPIAKATSSTVAASTYASADQLYRFSVFAISAVANTFQGWTLERTVTNPRRRQQAALLAHLGLGGAGLLGLAVLGPFASSVLFGEALRADRATCLWYGVAFFFLSASTPLMRNLLLPHGRGSFVLRTTVSAVLLGAITMYAFGRSGHLSGVALGLAMSEFFVCAVLAIPAWRLYVATPTTGPVDPSPAAADGS